MSPVTALTYVLPHRLLSAWARRLAHSSNPKLKQWLIDTVVRRFGVDLSEAVLQLKAMGVPMRWAFVTGMVGVASLRLAALYFGWQLPALQMLQMHP